MMEKNEFKNDFLRHKNPPRGQGNTSLLGQEKFRNYDKDKQPKAEEKIRSLITMFGGTIEIVDTNSLRLYKISSL